VLARQRRGATLCLETALCIKKWFSHGRPATCGVIRPGDPFVGGPPDRCGLVGARRCWGEPMVFGEGQTTAEHGGSFERLAGRGRARRGARNRLVHAGGRCPYHGDGGPQVDWGDRHVSPKSGEGQGSAALEGTAAKNAGQAVHVEVVSP